MYSFMFSAFVTIADYDGRAGKQTESEILNNQSDGGGGGAQFVKCDVRNWADQVSVFEAAVQNSPSKSCDIVIANAGIVGADDLFTLQGRFSIPRQPSSSNMMR